MTTDRPPLPEEPADPRELPEPPPQRTEPEMRNGSAWLGLALNGSAFLASLAVGWTGAVFAAALGTAFAVTGLVRVRRGRADNRSVALAGALLGVATMALGFVWQARAQECTPLRSDTDRFVACYQEHAGLF